MIEFGSKRVDPIAAWAARAPVAAVFLLNVTCAFAFIAHPQRYVAGFELSGVPGEAMVRGLGILFLMWNATYPPVIVQPIAHRLLFGVVLAQQAIGVVGESWLWLALSPGHPVLSSTGLRFIVFDAAGLVLMVAAFVLVLRLQSGSIPKGA